MNLEAASQKSTLPTSSRGVGAPIPRFAVEVACVILAAVLGFSLSQAYLQALDNPLERSYPGTLALTYPAILFAGGRGMGTAPPEAIPEIMEFLSRRADAFDLANIPDDLVVTPLTTPFELTHIHHLYAVGWTWRLFGVSIRSLMLLASLLCALSAVALYGIFRLGMSRPTSIIGVLLAVSSPAVLCMSNNIRDFGKTPFILFVLLIVLRLLARPVSGRRLPALAAALGLALGIGMGFRQDMVICLPPAVGTMLLVARIESAHPWRARLAALAVFLLVFVPLSRPVFRGAALEGNQASVHSFFQGVSPDTESRLDFGDASYDFLLWHDANLYAQAQVLAQRSGHPEALYNPHTAEYRWARGEADGPRMVNPGLYYTGADYARFARLLVREAVWQFPADLVARAWRSSVATFGIARAMQDAVARVDAAFPTWLVLIFRLHALLSFFFSHVGWLCAALVLVGLSARRFRLAVYMTGLLLWFAGYPSMLFEYRHIIYLIFVPIGASLICVEWSLHRLNKLQSVIQPPSPVDFQRHAGAVLNMLCLIALVTAALLAPLIVLRWRQTEQVHTLAERLAATTRAPVPTRVDTQEGLALVAPKAPLPGLVNADALPPGETAWEYVVIEFDTRGRDIPITLVYDARHLIHDYSQDILISGITDDAGGRVRLYFPVYEATTIHSPQLLTAFLEIMSIPSWIERIDPDRPLEEQDIWRRSKFLGVAFSEAYRDQFIGMYTVHDIDALSLLPIFQAPSDPRYLRPFKTGPWERALRHRLGDRCFRTIIVLVLLVAISILAVGARTAFRTGRAGPRADKA